MNFAVLLIGIVRMHDTARHLDMASITYHKDRHIDEHIRYYIEVKMNLAVLLVGIVRMHDTVRHLDMASIQGQLE